MIVSVVIPAYNHRQYVRQAIESVLAQSWSEIDLIVIDDGSTDGSVEFIEGIRKQKGSFRFIARENRGLIRTLNQGMEIAQGELVCLLASDDYFPSGSIQSRAQFLYDHPDHVAVFGDGIVMYGEEETGDRFMSEKQRRLFSVEDPVPDFIRGVNLPVHTMMVRRDTFIKVGGFDQRYRFCEDLDIQLMTFLEGKVGYVDVPVYCYRRHEENQSLTFRQVARSDRVRCYRKYLLDVPQLAPYRKLTRYHLRRQYLLLARYLRQIGGGEPHDRELLEGAWEFAWKDIRLLWHLICCRMGFVKNRPEN